ncbi:MAG: DUF1674 domain-containing protein [Rhodospirillaceae bacterium]|nr:DUF1674 domain-containing protein [Rhodospirillaceae bacterium]
MPASQGTERQRVVGSGSQTASAAAAGAQPGPPPGETPPAKPREVGGPAGPEPTRFGDWERAGRCIDF